MRTGDEVASVSKVAMTKVFVLSSRRRDFSGVWVTGCISMLPDMARQSEGRLKTCLGSAL